MFLIAPLIFHLYQPTEELNNLFIIAGLTMLLANIILLKQVAAIVYDRYYNFPLIALCLALGCQSDTFGIIEGENRFAGHASALNIRSRIASTLPIPGMLMQRGAPASLDFSHAA